MKCPVCEWRLYKLGREIFCSRMACDYTSKAPITRWGVLLAILTGVEWVCWIPLVVVVLPVAILEWVGDELS